MALLEVKASHEASVLLNSIALVFFLIHALSKSVLSTEDGRCTALAIRGCLELRQEDFEVGRVFAIVQAVSSSFRNLG